MRHERGRRSTARCQPRIDGKPLWYRVPRSVPTLAAPVWCRIPHVRDSRRPRRHRRRRSPRADSRAGDRSPVRRDEAQCAAFLAHDAETALVQLPMVMRAEQRHVVGAGLASVDPMLQVMPVEITFAVTAGERATAIACVERALQRRRHRAVLAPTSSGLPSSSSVTVTMLQSQSSRFTVSIGRSARPAPPVRAFASACTTT